MRVGRRSRALGGPLDCGNSGTTMRLLAGLLAASPFATVLTGDASLSRRPMERVAEPLRAMGADVATTRRPGRRSTIVGGALRGIDVSRPVPSAQVKGAVLLAGLAAEGETSVPSRRRRAITPSGRSRPGGAGPVEGPTRGA